MDERSMNESAQGLPLALSGPRGWDDTPTEHRHAPLGSPEAVWKRRFTREMVARGHRWYSEAGGNLMQHMLARGIGPDIEEAHA